MKSSKDSKINIAHIITGLGIGGAEIYLRMMLIKLDKKKYNHYVYFFNCSRDHQADSLLTYGINVKCLDFPSRFDLRRFFTIYRHLKSDSIDIVHSHLPVISIYTRILCFFLCVPVIYTEHNEWVRYNPITRLVNKLTYKLNSKIIAVSQEVYESISISNKENIITLNNAIDPLDLHIKAKNFSRELFLKHLNITDNNFIVGSVGNYTPKKNHQLLIKSFANFLKKYSVTNAYLVIVGQLYGKQSELESLAHTHNIYSKLILIDGVDSAFKFIRHFDVFALSSLYEGLPITLLEAMSFSRPIISTPAGGISSVITSGIDGLLADYDIDNYSDALNTLYTDKKYRSQLGKSAYSNVTNNYSLDSAAIKLEEIYDQLFNEGVKNS